MGTAFGPLLRIVGTRPERMADGFAGPFHEGLAQKLRALEAPVDPAHIPATLGDGRNSSILLKLSGRGIAFAWFAKGDEETRGEDGTGAWERLKEGEVGRRWGQWRDGAVEVLDRLQGGAELGHESPDEAHLGRDDPLIGRERNGRFDRLDALRDEARLHMVLAKEALEGGAACQMNRFEGGPLGEDVAEDRVPSQIFV